MSLPFVWQGRKGRQSLTKLKIVLERYLRLVLIARNGYWCKETGSQQRYIYGQKGDLSLLSLCQREAIIQLLHQSKVKEEARELWKINSLAEV